jgi:hypothetical protein
VAPEKAATNDGAQQLDEDLALEELGGGERPHRQNQQRALAPLKAAATGPKATKFGFLTPAKGGL